ncbi:hypothetical protein EAE96_005287 [Botrytis aclada]|nr:hypothetical protein EAE96_005287 [Botrytis aclada]
MSAPQGYHQFETVAKFMNRYNDNKYYWERSVRLGTQEWLGITADNLLELGPLRIPKGVKKDSWIKPDEDWFEENPDAYEAWESKIRNFSEGEEIIEVKALSEAFLNDPDSGFIHVTERSQISATRRILYILEPTSRNGPSRPVLPQNRAQHSVQPSVNTAGSLMEKPNSSPDLQRPGKLNDDPINPSTSSSVYQSSMTNSASQLLPQSNFNQQTVHPAANTAGFSSVTSAQMHNPQNISTFDDDPINSNGSFFRSFQTPPNNNSPSSATQGAITEFSWQWWQQQYQWKD